VCVFFAVASIFYMLKQVNISCILNILSIHIRASFLVISTNGNTDNITLINNVVSSRQRKKRIIIIVGVYSFPLIQSVYYEKPEEITKNISKIYLYTRQKSLFYMKVFSNTIVIFFFFFVYIDFRLYFFFLSFVIDSTSLLTIHDVLSIVDY
jgi:hypothetical protein